MSIDKGFGCAIVEESEANNHTGAQAMINLSIFESVAEDVVLDSEGKGYFTQRAVARLAGVNDMALVYHLKGAEQNKTKLAQMLTAAGFKGAEQNKMIQDTYVAVILEYYAFDAGKHCTKEARSFLRATSAVGLRTCVQQYKGYAPQTTKALTREQKLAEAFIIASEEIETLKAEVDTLVETVTTLEPKAKLADKFIDDNGLTTISDFAKDVAEKGLGRNNLYRLLRTKKILDGSNRPYQSFVNQGYFVVKPAATYVAYGNLCQQYVTYLTPKGVQWALKQLA